MKCQIKLEGGAYSWGVFILVVFFVTGMVISVLAGVYFSQISDLSYLGVSCCLYYWGVCYSGVSARQELTVHGAISGKMNKQGGGVLISSTLPFL